MAPARLHASCVAIEGLGVLLRGPSGVGKSDLALRLIDAGATLVADDQVELELGGGQVIARAPDALEGLLEVRGLGIVRLAFLREIALALVVDLAAEIPERMPEPATAELLGVALPLLGLDPRPPSAAATLRLAVRVAAGRIMRFE